MRTLFNKIKKVTNMLFADKYTPFHSPNKIGSIGYSYIGRLSV